MGMPEIPDMNSKIKVGFDIDFDGVINTTLLSIDMEELSLAHIMNAEAEKLQCFLDKRCKSVDFHEALKLNDNVRRTLHAAIKHEMLLQFKMENLMDLLDKHKCDRGHDDKKKCD